MGTQLIIWVIDDDPKEHLFVKRAFARNSCPNIFRWFHSATTAMQALEDADSDPDQLPHVILCDIRMPGMDGFEFLQWLRNSAWCAMPIALFSNSDIQSDVDRAYAMGANAFHVKSATLDELGDCLITISRFWGKVARLPSLGTSRKQLPH